MTALDGNELKGFHTKDGWYFDRLPNGAVEFRKESLGKNRHVTNRTQLDANTWASVLASVSKNGETGESFTIARDFHAGKALISLSDARVTDHVVTYRREDDKWDWHRVDPEGRVLCGSDQGYENFHDAWQMAVDMNPELPASNFEVIDPKAEG